ncbi:MAG: Enoyl-CoA hydratase [Ignavibacteria bacterium]|nr:Enoyl-CoA hydratase [Ignavibacteria bacterium]
MEFSTILFEKKDSYVVITLNRPDKLNALNKQMFDDLDAAIRSIELDESVKALILTGTGEKAFAAGADIKELNESGERSGKLFSEYGSYVMKRLAQLRIPTIAAINGFALGGGCELALSCQMRFASENAKLGQPEVNLGIIPGYGATQRLTHLVGKAKAMELILSAKMINAVEAEKIGMVNAVYPQAELLAKTEEFIQLILSKGSLAVAGAIECIYAADELSELEGLHFESKMFGRLCGTQDFKEGTAAFLEKRQANFTGK